jgi:hypothetical protein
LKQQGESLIKSLVATLMCYKKSFAYFTIFILLVTFFCLGLLAPGLPAGTDLLILPTQLEFVKKHFLWFSLWMPFDSFGYSIFYGTQFNFVLLPFALISDAVVATKLYVYAVFLLAGFSMYCFAHHYTNHEAASLLAAILFVFNPIFLVETYAGHHTIMIGYALAPLVFLTYDRAIASGRIRDIVVSALLLTTLFVAGHPQTTYIFGFFLLLLTFFELVSPRIKKSRFDSLKRVVKVSVLTLTLWILLSAYEIVPAISNAGLPSVLFSLGYTIEDTYTYSSEVYYILLAALPLTVTLLVFLRKHRYVVFFSVSALISSIISMGPYPPFGPIFTWAFVHVPLFDIFRVPYRFCMITVFAASFLTAFIFAQERRKIGHTNYGSFQNNGKHIFQAMKSSKRVIVVLAFAGVIVASGLFVGYVGFGFPLGTFSFPESYLNTYDWINQQPGDYKILTVPYPVHYVDTLSMVGINRGWVWDPPVYGQAVHGKVVVTGYGGTVDTQDFLHFIGTQILYNRTDDLMKTLGTFNIEYVMVNPYPFRDDPAQTEPMREFFTLQKGLIPVYQTDNISVLENSYWTPQVFATTNYALVVGGRDVLTSLNKVNSFNLNQWVLIYANQIDNTDFWKLLEGAGALILADDGFTDLVMMSINQGIRIRAVDYAFPSSDPFKYWIPSKWWTDQGKLVLSGATLQTNASIGLDVKLNVPTTGNYTVCIRMAFAPDRGRLSVGIDNLTLASLLPYANTSSGFKWVKAGSINLDQGEHTLRLKNDGSGLTDIDEIRILPTTIFETEAVKVQKALESSHARLVSTSEAENTLLYQEPSEWYVENSIEASNGAMIVHNSSLSGDKMVCSMLVPASEEYMIAARLAATTGGNMAIGVDGAPEVNISPSDLNMGWRWVSFGPLTLAAGEHKIIVDATGDARVDEIILFSDNNLLNRIDHIFDSDSKVSVKTEYVNSYTYKVSTQTSDPFLLVLSESYHPMWKAYVDAQSISSLPAYSFVNVFFMPEGSHEISVEFTGQTYVTLGGLISSATIISLVTLALLDWKLKKKVKDRQHPTHC